MPNNLGMLNTPEDPSQLSRPKERLVTPRPNPGLTSAEKSYLTKEPEQKHLRTTMQNWRMILIQITSHQKYNLKIVLCLRN